MPIVFGQLGAGNLTFGQLDQSLVTAFVQSEPARVTMSDNSTHEFDVVIEHALVADIEVYDASLQEFIPPGGAGSYLQSGRAAVQMFDASTHEFVPVVVTFNHPQETDGVVLSDGGAHLHFPGAAGDYIHNDAVVVTLASSGNHGYTPSQFVVALLETFSAVAQWLLDEPTELEMDFSDDVSSIQRIAFTITSQNQSWINDAGPFGGNVAVAVELVRNGAEPLPIVSLSAARPEAIIFDTPSHQEVFDALVDAMLDGPVSFRLGGYEALPNLSLPLDLIGDGTLSVQTMV